MYEIKEVSLGLIDPNPHRDLGNYPWMEHKLEALMRSIHDVGFWASVIGRPRGRRYELAFGHHRKEAARRLKMNAIPLIITELSDRQMLQYMGRENGEDYSADFLLMLNSWDGALKFVQSTHPSQDGKAVKSVVIARLLGWMEGDGSQMSAVARSCAAAANMIAGGFISRRDLASLSMNEAREIVERANSRIEQLAKIGAREGHSRAKTKEAQRIVGKAARVTAREASKGEVARTDLRNRVDLNVMRVTGTAKPEVRAPLFEVFGQALCDQIHRMLNDDSAGKRIAEIEKALPGIELDDDWAIIRRLHHELDEMKLRADRSKKRTTPNKVVRLKEITREGA